MELVTNDKSKEFKPKVKVQLGTEMASANEFFTVIYDPTTGKHSLYSNCDAVTLGMAYRLAAKKFKEAYDALTPSQRNEVDEIFNQGVRK